MSNKKRRYQSLPAPWFINQLKKLKPDKNKSITPLKLKKNLNKYHHTGITRIKLYYEKEIYDQKI